MRCGAPGGASFVNTLYIRSFWTSREGPGLSLAEGGDRLD